MPGSASWRSSGKGTASFCVPSGRPGARSCSWTGPIRNLWRSVKTWSAMKDGLSYEEELDARHLHLLFEAPGAGSAARSPHRGLGPDLCRDAFRHHRTEGLAAPCATGRRVLRAPRCCPALGPRRGGRHHGHQSGAAPRRDANRPNDIAIAGHAIAVGAVLVTNNTREFARVPGLVLEDWIK